MGRKRETKKGRERYFSLLERRSLGVEKAEKLLRGRELERKGREKREREKRTDRKRIDY